MSRVIRSFLGFIFISYHTLVYQALMFLIIISLIGIYESYTNTSLIQQIGKVKSFFIAAIIILISNYIVSIISLKRLNILEKENKSEKDIDKKIANTGLILYGIAIVADTIIIITILKMLT